MKIGSGVLKQFAVECRRAAGEYGLMKCSSGNISWRIGANHMLISSNSSWLSHLKEDQICICRISDAKCIDGKRPSIESAFHAGVLSARKDINVVMHYQTPFATALACRKKGIKVDYNVILEIPFYVGEVAAIPFFEGGSPSLAKAVVAALKDHNMVQLTNHGQVTVGKDFNDAIQKAVFFEMACQMIVEMDFKVNVLSAASVKMLQQSGRSASGKAV